MYDDIHLHVARSHTSSADFDIILNFVQPSYLRFSSLPSSLYFHFHRHPSYAVFLSSRHMRIPFQPHLLDFLCDFPHFRCPSYSFISYFVHIHRTILISATSNLFSCAFSIAHVSAPYTRAGVTTVLYTFPLIFTFIFLSHNTPDTLLQFFLSLIGQSLLRR